MAFYSIEELGGGSLPINVATLISDFSGHEHEHTVNVHLTSIKFKSCFVFAVRLITHA